MSEHNDNDDTIEAPRVLKFESIQGGKVEDVVGTDPEVLPTNEYVIVAHTGEEFVADGFLVFTSHHIAVMRETVAGALPVLVVPLTSVKYAEIVEDFDEVFDD